MRAGLSQMDITPGGPIWMTGYSSRTHPSEGVAQRLRAKALAIEDSAGSRIVVVTTDLIGLPRSITDAASARLAKAHGLVRANLLFNSSHTHAGPVVRGNLPTMFELPRGDQARIDNYARTLTDQLVEVAEAAIGDLSPAMLDYGFEDVDFAINRRHPTPKGVTLAENSTGPVDHTVPVIRIRFPNGGLRAVLFGYACHNTTLTGDYYQISGDYAGAAQAALEQAHPGAMALFLMLCGADQNPAPRGTAELADRHGSELAREVDRILSTALAPVRGPLRTAFEVTELDFAPHSKEQFEKETSSSNPAAVRRAKAMLQAYEERHPVRRIPYPVQAIRLDRNLVILALGGEVVVDYSLRAKQQLGEQSVIVAGYSNDVMCYIPSRRVLNEGGYEVSDSMIYYGQPGPLGQDVEDRIFASISRVINRVRR